MKKLGLDPSAIQGSENRLDAIKTAINILKNADPADVTPKVDQVGVQDNIDAIQTYIKSKFAEATKAAVKANADTNAADTAAGDIKDKVGSVNSNVTTQTDDNNIASARATIEQGVAGIPLTFTVDPEQIKKSIGTIDVTGGAGGGVLSSIETLVSTIQGYVETIRDRLPITALA
jgi:tetrahydromethanopterin S-methyltransferase subunit F